ncbi:DUF6168 family protein [Flagellimonas allohymeniacidonis]|uniref:DUF4293 family protein n=1 Tax=Flagellimonas allohymeniacidonis TaxID=2517819 RepID=A0A4V2HSF5_9FLAO|nr:DUF6168 family protein [Allomuricauda hymeniacidonis]TAI47510.1 hypothetical protein EW142_12640 [Allomuricauda hymeniacidonis]
MTKPNLPAQFILILVFLLSLSFLVHTQILKSLDLPPFENLIFRAYWVNAILAAVIFLLIYIFREKLKNLIGFLFMGGSLIKFAFFFILFYPTYKQDGDMSRLEFGAFFIPYAIALIFETIFISKLLKKIEGSSVNQDS